MPRRPLFLLALLFVAVSAFANPITFTGTSGNLSATATFNVTGTGDLTVVLTNTDNTVYNNINVIDQVHVLSAVVFNAPTGLTPSAIAFTSGSHFVNGSGNLGDGWGYETGSFGGSNTAISATGAFDGTANGNFPGNTGSSNLDGIAYGIVGNGYVAGTGTGGVNSSILEQNSVTFTFSGLPGTFKLSDITGVRFQYGTATNETNFPGTPNSPVPEPSSVLLMSTGLVGLGGFVRRRLQ